MTRIARKALIYATSPRGLLVFDEPDFPSVPTQVPGGTIDAGETPMEAAYREFEEETGLVADQMDFLGAEVFVVAGYGPVHRSFFHTDLSADVPTGWDHYERHAGGSTAPILFRFRWVELQQAAAMLGEGMGRFVHLIP